MKIRVLHIVLSLGTGGLENGIVNLVNGIDQEKFEVDILCLRFKGEIANRITNENTNVLFTNEALGVFSAIQEIRRICKQKKYDILHTHGWATLMPSFIVHKMGYGGSIVNGEHGTLYYETMRQRVLQRFLFNKVDLNLSVSETLIGEIREKFQIRASNFRSILNGVDTCKFKFDEIAKKKIRNELGLSEDVFVVGTVGRLVRVKNYESLLYAFSKFCNKESNSVLVIAGDGPLIKELKLLSNKLDIKSKVIFLGQRNDISSVMNVFDVFVLPSFREGLSNTILEAMSSELAVIASKVGGNSEIIQDGLTGRLYNSGNVDELCESISYFKNNRRALNDVSSNARAQIVSQNSLKVMVKNYQDTYKELYERAG